MDCDQDNILIGLEDLAWQAPTDQDSFLPLNLKQMREQAETLAIKRSLTHTDNNVSNAAKLLGVTQPTLYTLFSKYGIEGHS